MVGWLNKLLGRDCDQVSPAEKEELRQAQVAHSSLRDEAEALLDEAKSTGGVLRESRQQNHYIKIIDDMFRGGTANATE